MWGLIINSLAIIGGSLVGFLFKKILKKLETDVFDGILKILGISVLFIGIYGMFKSTIVINDELKFTLSDELLIVLMLALSLGTLIGSIIALDVKVKKLETFLVTKFGKNKNATDIKQDTIPDKDKKNSGFIEATMIFCIGAMALVGPILAANGDLNMLLIKSLIDFVTAIILTFALGISVIWSFTVTFIYELVFFLLGFFFMDFMQGELITLLSMVGYSLLIAVSLNFILDCKLKVINSLPSIFLVIIYYIVKVIIIK